MIQKRYQYLTKQGVQWTPWFDYREGNKETLKELKKSEKYQFGKLLLNEFRLWQVKED